MPRPLKPLPYKAATARARLRRADPKLAQLMREVGPFRLQLDAGGGTFDSLLRAIVYQQLSGKAAATIYRRLRALYPQNRATARRVRESDDAELRGAGLSWAKVAAAKDLADKTLQGVVPGARQLQTLSDEEIIRRLVAVRGVGRWTVEMLLIFNQGRPDVLPVSDLGIRKGFMYAFGLRKLPREERLLAHGKRWAPYRSVASWYLWRAVDLYEGRERD